MTNVLENWMLFLPLAPAIDPIYKGNDSTNVKIEIYSKISKISKKNLNFAVATLTLQYSVCPWTPVPSTRLVLPVLPLIPPTPSQKCSSHPLCSHPPQPQPQPQPASGHSGRGKKALLCSGRKRDRGGGENKSALSPKKVPRQEQEDKKGGGKATHSSALERSWQRWDFLITPLWEKKVFVSSQGRTRGRKCGLLKWVRRRWLAE